MMGSSCCMHAPIRWRAPRRTPPVTSPYQFSTAESYQFLAYCYHKNHPAPPLLSQGEGEGKPTSRGFLLLILPERTAKSTPGRIDSAEIQRRRRMRTILGIGVGLCLLSPAGAAAAQPAREEAPPAGTSARTAGFDPEAATEAYLAKL